MLPLELPGVVVPVDLLLLPHAASSVASPTSTISARERLRVGFKGVSSGARSRAHDVCAFVRVDGTKRTWIKVHVDMYGR